MEELGSILREAREMKGLTLSDVQRETRINARYIQALEEGQYELLPTPVHTRGFLRNYARFLELEPAPLLERYEARAQQGRSSGSAILGSGDTPAARSDQTFFNPVNMDLSGNPAEGPERTMRVIILVALLITIGLVASRFISLGEGDSRDNLPALIESLLEPAPPEPGVDDGETGDEVMPAVTSQPILPTERNNPDAVTTGVAPAVTRVRPALPATMESIRLVLEITERTWIRVTIDGEVVFEDQVVQEDSPLEWEASEEARLLTGNAAGVFVTINGVEIGRLGGRGEVAEERWATTGN